MKDYLVNSAEDILQDDIPSAETMEALKEKNNGNIDMVISDLVLKYNITTFDKLVNSLFEIFSVEEIAVHYNALNLFVIRALTLKNQIRQFIKDGVIPDILGNNWGDLYSHKWLYSCGEVMK